MTRLERISLALLWALSVTVAVETTLLRDRACQRPAVIVQSLTVYHPADAPRAIAGLVRSQLPDLPGMGEKR